MTVKNHTKEQHPKHKLDLYLDNPDFDINNSIIELYKELGLNRKKQETALKVVLFSLFFSYGEKVAVPRAKKALAPTRYNPNNIGYSALRTVLDKLNEYGYVHQEIGYRDFADNIKRTTTIQSGFKLGCFFSDYKWHNNEEWFSHSPEFVVLRDNSKNKTLIDYTDNDKSIWMRDELSQYNDLLSDSEILLVKENQKTGEQEILEEYSGTVVTRKFIQHNTEQSEIETSYGGRMYAPWCNISSKQREMITIEDEKTVELDLEASSINITYVMQTAKKYPNGDPYKLTVGGVEIPRYIVKQATTIMFNTKSISGAVAALEAHYLPSVFNDNRSKKDIIKAEGYKTIKLKVKPGDIVRAILNKHIQVSHYFLQGKKVGDYIACQESDRVFEIVRRFAKRGILVLTVYDSFIIQEQYKDDLQELMNELHPLEYDNRKHPLLGVA